MPIYEYRCENGDSFEVLQGFSDDPVTKCEVCGGSVQRVYRAPAVHFKGSGFYNTDYGTKKRSRELKEGKEAAANGSGTKSDSKGSDSASKSSDGNSSSNSSSSSSSDSGSAKRSESQTS